MKNAIATWFHYENYGTSLQAYALQKFLNNNNEKTDLINYVPNHEKLNEKKKINFKNIYNFIKNRKKGFLMKIAQKKYLIELQEKKNKYKKFLDNEIPLTEKVYTKENLAELNDKYDNFIVGSDQIWNPMTDSTFFLDFVDDQKNKIAYAPSFGVTTLEKSRGDQIKPFLNRFNYLSVRESNGKKILKELINKETEVVLDPTLLLTKKEWLNICNYNNTKEKYILCYFLGEQKYYWKYLEKIKKETGYSVKIIPIQPEAFFKKETLEVDVGPIEFLELISNAEIIITDSFHGTVFAVIMEKNFTVLKRFKDTNTKSQNSRIYNFLKIIGKEDHFLDETNTKVVYKVENYDEIKSKLNKEREKSIEYLIGAINKK